MTQKHRVAQASAGDAAINGRAALQAVTDFLSTIGIAWRWLDGAKGFCDGVDIVGGVLLVDPLAKASTLLHEAGHLATLPGEFRRHAQRNISGVQKLALEAVAFSDPDAPIARAAMQCSDPEATAWAWAAGVHLGLDPRLIIQDDEYGETGALIRLQLVGRAYAGINGLHHAGFCAQRPGAYADARGLPAFPELLFWLQRDFGKGLPAHEERADCRDVR